MWRQIAHERVEERLDKIFVLAAFRSGFRAPQDDLLSAYSAQASRFKNSTSRIVARDLEEAVLKVEDNHVQSAFQVYCDETPQREVTDTTLLWLIYNLGLIPFIETRILRDSCFKLDNAQPSLGLNLLRPDGERFFSYRSEKFGSEFPDVIRIVDRLKSDWSDKIAGRALQIGEGATLRLERDLQQAKPTVRGKSQRSRRPRWFSSRIHRSQNCNL